MSPTLPNFVVVGAAKCGTTSLHRYLGQHPEVFVPEHKELHFFSHGLLAANCAGPGDAHAVSSACATRADYERHYAGAGGSAAVGDVSPSYLYFHAVAPAMREALGEARIVILLRDPVEKAFSQYMHLVRDGRETLPFEEGLAAESQRTRDRWAVLWRYVGSSRYTESVARYREVFGADRVRVLFQEELQADAQAAMAELFAFLGVDPSFRADTSTTHHRSGRPRSRLVSNLVSKPGLASRAARALLSDRARHRLRGAIQNLNTGAKDALRPATRRRLRKAFAEDTARLEALLGRAVPWGGGE